MASQDRELTPPRSASVAKMQQASLLDSPSRVTRYQLRRMSAVGASSESVASPSTRRPTRGRHSVAGCASEDSDAASIQSEPGGGGITTRRTTRASSQQPRTPPKVEAKRARRNSTSNTTSSVRITRGRPKLSPVPAEDTSPVKSPKKDLEVSPKKEDNLGSPRRLFTADKSPVKASVEGSPSKLAPLLEDIVPLSEPKRLSLRSTNSPRPVKNTRLVLKNIEMKLDLLAKGHENQETAESDKAVTPKSSQTPEVDISPKTPGSMEDILPKTPESGALKSSCLSSSQSPVSPVKSSTSRSRSGTPRGQTEEGAFQPECDEADALQNELSSPRTRSRISSSDSGKKSTPRAGQTPQSESNVSTPQTRSQTPLSSSGKDTPNQTPQSGPSKKTPQTRSETPVSSKAGTPQLLTPARNEEDKKTKTPTPQKQLRTPETRSQTPLNDTGKKATPQSRNQTPRSEPGKSPTSQGQRTPNESAKRESIGGPSPRSRNVTPQSCVTPESRGVTPLSGARQRDQTPEKPRTRSSASESENSPRLSSRRSQSRTQSEGDVVSSDGVFKTPVGTPVGTPGSRSSVAADGKEESPVLGGSPRVSTRVSLRRSVAKGDTVDAQDENRQGEPSESQEAEGESEEVEEGRDVEMETENASEKSLAAAEKDEDSSGSLEIISEPANKGGEDEEAKCVAAEEMEGNRDDEDESLEESAKSSGEKVDEDDQSSEASNEEKEGSGVIVLKTISVTEETDEESDGEAVIAEVQEIEEDEAGSDVGVLEFHISDEDDGVEVIKVEDGGVKEGEVVDAVEVVEVEEADQEGNSADDVEKGEDENEDDDDVQEVEAEVCQENEDEAGEESEDEAEVCQENEAEVCQENEAEVRQENEDEAGEESEDEAGEESEDEAGEESEDEAEVCQEDKAEVCQEDKAEVCQEDKAEVCQEDKAEVCQENEDEADQEDEAVVEEVSDDEAEEEDEAEVGEENEDEDNGAEVGEENEDNGAEVDENEDEEDEDQVDERNKDDVSDKVEDENDMNMEGLLSPKHLNFFESHKKKKIDESKRRRSDAGLFKGSPSMCITSPTSQDAVKKSSPPTESPRSNTWSKNIAADVLAKESDARQELAAPTISPSRKETVPASSVAPVKSPAQFSKEDIVGSAKKSKKRPQQIESDEEDSSPVKKIVVPSQSPGEVKKQVAVKNSKKKSKRRSRRKDSEDDDAYDFSVLGDIQGVSPRRNSFVVRDKPSTTEKESTPQCRLAFVVKKLPPGQATSKQALDKPIVKTSSGVWNVRKFEVKKKNKKQRLGERVQSEDRVAPVEHSKKKQRLEDEVAPVDRSEKKKKKQQRLVEEQRLEDEVAPVDRSEKKKKKKKMRVVEETQLESNNKKENNVSSEYLSVDDLRHKLTSTNKIKKKTEVKKVVSGSNDSASSLIVKMKKQVAAVESSSGERADRKRKAAPAVTELVGAESAKKLKVDKMKAGGLCAGGLVVSDDAGLDKKKKKKKKLEEKLRALQLPKKDFVRVGNLSQSDDDDDAPTAVSFSDSRQLALQEESKKEAFLAEKEKRAREKKKLKLQRMAEQKAEKLKRKADLLEYFAEPSENPVVPKGKKTYFGDAQDEFISLNEAGPSKKKPKIDGTPSSDQKRQKELTEREKKRREKGLAELLKRHKMKSSSFVPVEAPSGATRFGVVPLKNLNNDGNRIGEAAAFRSQMLYGNRVNRVPNHVWQSQNEKKKAGNLFSSSRAAPRT